MSRKRKTKTFAPKFSGPVPTPLDLEPLFRAAYIRDREMAKDAAWRRLSGYEKLEQINRLRELRLERYGR